MFGFVLHSWLGNDKLSLSYRWKCIMIEEIMLYTLGKKTMQTEVQWGELNMAGLHWVARQTGNALFLAQALLY